MWRIGDLQGPSDRRPDLSAATSQPLRCNPTIDRARGEGLTSKFVSAWRIFLRCAEVAVSAPEVPTVAAPLFGQSVALDLLRC
jgi:hypothetical protein